MTVPAKKIRRFRRRFYGFSRRAPAADSPAESPGGIPFLQRIIFPREPGNLVPFQDSRFRNPAVFTPAEKPLPAADKPGSQYHLPRRQAIRR
ncbi:MAG: hypothetical protein C6P37_07190 [Caldibacillus debilis]|uniref:Uncharacterized protein n=1 Tax=Caldibacillus debilis TaxID=301148 RepID=A0A3E0K5E9_9BACI|nr:MAG: hypothetical protein C6P37_07190 [Caldibacillus debilis]